MRMENRCLPTHSSKGTSTEIDASSMLNEIELPSKRQFACASICAFSKQAKHRLEYEEQCKSARKLWGFIALSLLFMVVEIVGGLMANSLAILTDAAHMLTDVAGFAISLLAIWASGWEPTPRRSFGFFRIEVLGALLSIQLIWVIAGYLIYEAFDRILHKKVIVHGKLMFIIAAFGFAVNLIMAIWLGHDHVHRDKKNVHRKHPNTSYVEVTGQACEEGKTNFMSSSLGKYKGETSHASELKTSNTSDDVDSSLSTTNHVIQVEKKRGMSHQNMNLEGVYLHVMGDLIQSTGVMISAATIWVKPDWQIVDPLCIMVFCIVVIWTTKNILKSIFDILLEGTPSEIDVTGLENELSSIDGVRGVHDLHVWAISAGKVVLACHVIVGQDTDSNEVLLKVQDYCEETYQIRHTTIQIEREGSTPTI